MPSDNPYHVHVYFDETSIDTARQVIGNLSENFSLEVGSYHPNPVGPHPTGSCQVTVEVKNFGPVMDWLAKNRQGLTIFTHADTGDVIKDHTDHTIWMGEMMTLDIEMLRQFVAQRADRA